VAEKLEAPDPHVRGDFARLQQVFWNLLTNVAKFSPEDSIIEVSTYVTEPGGRISVQIADQGIGILPDKLDRIFDAFEQGALHTHAGLGLGLAISKALVEMHSGVIAAHSDGPNCGSKFTVRLPSAMPSDQPNGESKHQFSPHEGLRLLVVEDHPDTLGTLTRLLTRRGYIVRTAAFLAESLEVARAYEFDVLISDIGLPDGRGTELLEQFFAIHGWRPPAIAMSGFGMDDDVERSQQAGFSEHLTKPVEFSALQEAISRLASRQSSKG
jgi:hypothetical protein